MTIQKKSAGPLVTLLVALCSAAMFCSIASIAGVQAFGPVNIKNQHHRSAAFHRRRKESQISTPTALFMNLSSGAATSFLNEIKRRLNWRNTNAAASNGLYMDPLAKKIANVEISWEPEMAERLLELQREREVELAEQGKTLDRPLMVGVVGIPGSGKSTSCEILQSFLNTAVGAEEAIVMPMDGYHYSLKQLEEEFQNPVDAIYRRGAPDTFDPASLYKDLERIVNGNEAKVSIPGFDHARGDPEPNQHTFDRKKHKIVICEGIYVMHDGDGWDDIKQFLDYSIYIVADIDQCIGRLKERNKCIPGYSPEEIDIRCDAVDRVNAQLVERSRKYANEEVYSAASSVPSTECDIAFDEEDTAIEESSTEASSSTSTELDEPELVMTAGVTEEKEDEEIIASADEEGETVVVASDDETLEAQSVVSELDEESEMVTADATEAKEEPDQEKVSYYF